MSEDVVGVTTLFALFGAALVLYGGVLFRGGNKDLLPIRARHTVRNKADVQRVGKIVLVMGAVLLAAMLLVFVVMG